MPMSMMKLQPGVNVELTASQLEAGYAQSNFGRFRSGLFEKIGGWTKYYPFAVGGVPKALHAWLDLNSNEYLGVGTTTNLSAITEGVQTDLTPQSFTSDILPVFTSTASSTTISITDANISNVTIYDTVEFRTPVTIGGVILSGAYPIDLVLGATNYNISSSFAATQTRSNATITGATQANPCVITAANNFADGDLVYITGVVGMTPLNGGLYTVTASSGTGFSLLGIDSTGYTAYASGGVGRIAQVPHFATGSGSALVTVTLQGHGLSAGGTINLPIATTVGGVTIIGTYNAVTVVSADVFTISVTALASSTASAFMNDGEVQIVYHIAQGAVAASTGYSVGDYSDGSYSTGSSSAAQTGTPITATDWSLDNWGEVFLATPDGGGLYAWDPNSGFQNAQFISGAPIYNTGMFVSQATQMVIMYGSTTDQEIGVSQDPLLVKWCAQGDYTSWGVGSNSQAGSRRLPNGSRCVAGMSVPQQELIWTDLDLWAMSYLGYPSAWGFNKIGSNCGAIAKHAVTKQGAAVYWQGISNFFMLGGSAPQVIPCTVWDTVFQDLNTAYQHTCYAWSNTPFNEVWFFFPRLSTNATTPDYFVKYNTLTQLWDNGGALDRTCGIDSSLLGMPISATSTGIVYEHETSPDADGQAINSYFLTGDYALSDGNEMMFVDWVLPDMKFGDVGSSTSASLQITFFAKDYPGSSITNTYGPFTYNSTTKYLNPRLRGRVISMKIESNDIGSWWRIGAMRIRSAPDGRL